MPKIQKNQDSQFVVTIPQALIKTMNIQKGEEWDFFPIEGGMILLKKRITDIRGLLKGVSIPSPVKTVLEDN